MDGSTTRISDLPDNITMQMNTSNSNSEGIQTTPTNYTPINVHPNPYGVSAQNPIMPIPQPQHQQPTQQMEQIAAVQRQQLNEQQQNEINNMQPVRLPSRDVRLDTAGYLHDEQVHANYIPKPKLTKDYILDYEETSEKATIANEKKKRREHKIDEMLSELQTPVFIAILFFIFQLPIMNTLVFKRFSFLSIYSEDGQFNFYGLLFKSSLFGLLFYSVQKIITFISEF